MWQVLMTFIPEDYDHVCVITVCKRLPPSLVDCVKSSFSSACFIKNERPKANTWSCLSVPLRWRTIPLPFFSTALIMWRNWRCHFEFIMSIKLKRNGLFWGLVCLFACTVVYFYFWFSRWAANNTINELSCLFIASTGLKYW